MPFREKKSFHFIIFYCILSFPLFRGLFHTHSISLLFLMIPLAVWALDCAAEQLRFGPMPGQGAPRSHHCLKMFEILSVWHRTNCIFFHQINRSYGPHSVQNYPFKCKVPKWFWIGLRCSQFQLSNSFIQVHYLVAFVLSLLSV